MIATPVFAGFVAVLLWLWGTGAILLVVRRCEGLGAIARLGAVIWGLPFLVFGWVAVVTSTAQESVSGVYLGFVGALAIWGWIELAFLTGVVTGPNKKPLPRGEGGGLRFAHAFGALAWHEVLLALPWAALFAVATGMPNQIALWAFGILLGARVLAKLNLFMGVPGINLEAVPVHLAHLKSYFRLSDPSWLFPLSITLLCGMTGLFAERLIFATSNFGNVTFALLAALSALALLEHWMMLIPLADAKLWRWMAPKHNHRVGPKAQRFDRTANHDL